MVITTRKPLSIAQIGIAAIIIAVVAGIVYSNCQEKQPANVGSELIDSGILDKQSAAEKPNTEPSEESLIQSAVDLSFLRKEDHHTGPHWAVKGVTSGVDKMPRREAQVNR